MERLEALLPHDDFIFTVKKMVNKITEIDVTLSFAVSDHMDTETIYHNLMEYNDTLKSMAALQTTGRYKDYSESHMEFADSYPEFIESYSERYENHRVKFIKRIRDELSLPDMSKPKTILNGDILEMSMLELIRHMLDNNDIHVAEYPMKYNKLDDALIYDDCLCIDPDVIVELVRSKYENAGITDYKKYNIKYILDRLEQDNALKITKSKDRKFRTIHLYKLPEKYKGKRFVCIYMNKIKQKI